MGILSYSLKYYSEGPNTRGMRGWISRRFIEEVRGNQWGLTSFINKIFTPSHRINLLRFSESLTPYPSPYLRANQQSSWKNIVVIFLLWFTTLQRFSSRKTVIEDILKIFSTALCAPASISCWRCMSLTVWWDTSMCQMSRRNIRRMQEGKYYHKMQRWLMYVKFWRTVTMRISTK